MLKRPRQYTCCCTVRSSISDIRMRALVATDAWLVANRNEGTTSGFRKQHGIHVNQQRLKVSKLLEFKYK